MFYKLSLEEMDHSDALHRQVVNLIESFKRANGEPPASMLAVYEYMHERHVEHATEVKLMQAMYKGNSGLSL